MKKKEVERVLAEFMVGHKYADKNGPFCHRCEEYQGPYSASLDAQIAPAKKLGIISLNINPEISASTLARIITGLKECEG